MDTQPRRDNAAETEFFHVKGSFKTPYAELFKKKKFDLNNLKVSFITQDLYEGDKFAVTVWHIGARNTLIGDAYIDPNDILYTYGIRIPKHVAQYLMNNDGLNKERVNVMFLDRGIWHRAIHVIPKYVTVVELTYTGPVCSPSPRTYDVLTPEQFLEREKLESDTLTRFHLGLVSMYCIDYSKFSSMLIPEPELMNLKKEAIMEAEIHRSMTGTL